MIKIAPSILSADFANLAVEVKDAENGGADYIHVDVMDGHFVPNITIGPMIVSAIKPITNLPLDVHLMIENPDQYVANFANAGADIITVHQEACVHLHRTIQLIKSHGLKAGVTINPATSAETIRNILADVDLVLVMSVNPGFGGQKFIPFTLDKITQIAAWKKAYNLEFEIEVDGGINPDTALQCTKAGADVLVAGSAIFNQSNRKQAIRDLSAAAQKGAENR